MRTPRTEETHKTKHFNNQHWFVHYLHLRQCSARPTNPVRSCANLGNVSSCVDDPLLFFNPPRGLVGVISLRNPMRSNTETHLALLRTYSERFFRLKGSYINLSFLYLQASSLHRYYRPICAVSLLYALWHSPVPCPKLQHTLDHNTRVSSIEPHAPGTTQAIAASGATTTLTPTTTTKSPTPA
jgi:hypothetical protein